MAATRASNYAPHKVQLGQEKALERLQYRVVETEGGAAPGMASTRPPVTLFQPRADSPLAAQEAAENTKPVLAERDWIERIVQLEQALQEEKAASVRAIASARDQGRREESMAQQERFAAERKQQSMRIVNALEEFRAERQRYFDRLEREVVRLAMAIATRILHREAQLDPLFLTGAVRVALDKLSDSSGVVVRVAPSEVTAWRTWFRTKANSRNQPGVMEDPSLAAGECVLETQLGSIELGIRAQLEEIEKGFFDLLDHRPTGATRPSFDEGPSLEASRT